MDKPEQALDFVQDAVSSCSYSLGTDIHIALNCAASEFYDQVGFLTFSSLWTCIFHNSWYPLGRLTKESLAPSWPLFFINKTGQDSPVILKRQKKAFLWSRSDRASDVVARARFVPFDGFWIKGPCLPKRLCALVFLFWNDSFVKCSVLIGFHFWRALRDDTKNDCQGSID